MEMAEITSGQQREQSCHLPSRCSLPHGGVRLADLYAQKPNLDACMAKYISLSSFGGWGQNQRSACERLEERGFTLLTGAFLVERPQ